MDRLILNQKKGRAQLFVCACPWLKPGPLHWKKQQSAPKASLGNLKMRASLRLTIAVMLAYSAWALPSSLRQEQAPQATPGDQKVQEQNQPTANPPAQVPPPAANNPATPTTA